MFDFDVPFFRPLWVRIVTVLSCVIWGLIELSMGAGTFAVIFLSAGIYAAYRLFITFDPPEEDS